MFRHPPAKRRHHLALLLTLVGVGGGGCVCGARPRPPGQVVVLLESAPETLDRRFALSVNAQRVSSLIEPGLLRIDDSGKAVPDLCQRFERVGPTRYRFHLRPGLTFQDGSPLTARDVVYTYQSLKDPKVGSPLAPQYQEIAQVVAVDPLTVDIELSKPFAPLLLDLTMGIVPAKLEDPAYRKRFADHPVGAGPFELASRPDQEHLVLRPFAHYYGGKPAIRELEFVVVRDETTRVLSLLHGDADLVVNAISPVLLPRLEASPRLRVVHRPGAGYAYLAFNLRDPVLAHLRVREAVAHAIDRAEIVKYKFKGAAELATGMLPRGHWAYAPSQVYDYDPAKAKALLDAAGYPDPDGDGPKMRFTVSYKTSTDRFRQSVALVIARDLERVGIGVKLESYEWGTFYGDIKRGRFQITTLKWTPVIEPHLFHWVFASSAIPTEANHWVGGNRGGYVNPRIDQLTDAAASELDPAKRAALYGQVQRILAHDLPYVSLWHEDTVAVMSRRLRDFDVSPFGFLGSLARARVAPAATGAAR